MTVVLPNVSLATCNYHQWTPDMGAPIQTSIGKPRWWPAEKQLLLTYCHDLAPRYRYFKAADDEFEREYIDQINRRGVEKLVSVFTDLADKTGEGTLVLLCHEKTNTAAGCHRRIFADWWQEQTGETIPELGGLAARPRRDPDPDQDPSLF